jgi:hypothetical protein
VQLSSGCSTSASSIKCGSSAPIQSAGRGRLEHHPSAQILSPSGAHQLPA